MLPALQSPQEVISQLNLRNDVHGILLQLPLPEQQTLPATYFSNLISPEKDVDG